MKYNIKLYTCSECYNLAYKKYFIKELNTGILSIEIIKIIKIKMEPCAMIALFPMMIK